jgi:hypothetical protein
MRRKRFEISLFIDSPYFFEKKNDRYFPLTLNVIHKSSDKKFIIKLYGAVPARESV